MTPLAMTDSYAPVMRDRAAERERCEAETPGYREMRESLEEPWLPERTSMPTPADFGEAEEPSAAV